MITGELKSRIDRIWDSFWSGGISNPLEVIEQIYVMLRIGSMNMLLHGIEGPDIRYRDSLSEGASEDTEKYTLILANPPFAGSLDHESTSKDLQRVVKTKKTELLFLALFLKLLKPGGRAAVIVPDGVLFGSSKAHKDLRRILVEDQKLDAVVKLPSGVFRPYAGVSTAILFFTKTDSGGTDDVWFYDVRADGFSLDDKRNPVEANDLPDVLGRDFAGLCSADMYALEVDANRAIPQFIAHLLRGRAFLDYATSRPNRANIPKLNRDQLMRFVFDLPSLVEQRRIAAILDQADALRAKRRQVLAHLDTLTQSIFYEMFGACSWNLATLDEISTISGEYGANVPSIEMAEGLPRYVRITDITETGGLNHEARAPGGSSSDWQRYRLEEGDLLFARSGATVGKTYRHREHNGDCVFAGYLIRYRGKQGSRRS